MGDPPDDRAEGITHALSDSQAGIVSNVARERAGTSAVSDTVALCLSGGGYRAMLFHVGVLWRLNELGVLRDLGRMSSVSGGSIAAAQLAIAWPGLRFDVDGVALGFEDSVVAPLRRLASTTIDAHATLTGLLRPRTTIGDRVAAAYAKQLFGDRTLQDLPDDSGAPRFVINATNLQSGALWRFSRRYMADYRVGMVLEPSVRLADAVAASSAFPPVLSPVVLRVDPSDYTEESHGWPLHRPPFTTHVVLTDGGVYDNLGVETAWKNHRAVIVSDGGAGLRAEEKVARTWPGHMARILKVVDSQVRARRRQQVVASYVENDRRGAFIGISTPLSEYPIEPRFGVPDRDVATLAAEPTRLRAMPAARQRSLINWGYAACDASVRSYFMPSAAPPPRLPILVPR